jgi:hypothetical protein
LLSVSVSVSVLVSVLCFSSPSSFSPLACRSEALQRCQRLHGRAWLPTLQQATR